MAGTCNGFSLPEVRLRLLMIATFHFLIFAAPEALAQSDLQQAQNLSTCLAGRYPILCKRQWLSADEVRKVEIAERRENLKTCLAGRYPVLCNRSKLSAEERRQVIAAERRENLKTCLVGRYKNLCKKQLLTQDELEQVLAAEGAENLKTCLAGRYPSLCDHSLLSPEQLSRVQAAQSRASQAQVEHAARAPTARTVRSDSSGCESGHWVKFVSDDGQTVGLEDGSVWTIDIVDTIVTLLWLPTTGIVVCDDMLINTDDNESVQATRIR